MTAHLTEADHALLKGRNFAHFATLNEDGSPHVAPLWIDVDDNGRILVNTALGRRKDRNVRRDRRVGLSISPQDDPYTWLSVQGTVVEIEEGDGPLAHIGELSMRYDAEPWEPVDGQVRVIYRIRPDVVLHSA